MRYRTLWLIGVSASLALSTLLLADPPANPSHPTSGADLNGRIGEMESQIAAMQAQLQSLRATAAARAEHERAIDRAIADAHRSTAAGTPPTTLDYRDGFVLSASPDFTLKFNGLLQPRYVFNHADAVGDDNEGGFVIRRAEWYVSGNAFDPKLLFQFGAGFDRAGGAFQVIYANVGYKLTDAWEIRGGAFKGPFTAEELTSSMRQQAADRSLINTLFSVGITEGVQAQFARDPWRIAVMIHDGTNSVDTDFQNDTTDLGIAARAEYYLGATSKSFTDFEGWTDVPTSTRLAAAIDYERGETGGGAVADVPNVLKYLLEITCKTPGWSGFATAIAKHTDDAASEPIDQYALQLQGARFVIPDRLELYTRYEHVWLDGTFGTMPTEESQLDVITLGTNYFFHRHNAKLTLDVGYVFDAVPSAVSSVGLLASPDGPQFIVRGGFSLAF